MTATQSAENLKCNRCEKKAVVFVGLTDPISDIRIYPMCKEHAMQWKLEVLEKLIETETK